MDGLVVFGAGVFRDSPAAIADVADTVSLVRLNLVILHLESKLPMMRMMLKSSHKASSIKKRSPILKPSIDDKPIILNHKISTDPSVLSVQEG